MLELENHLVLVLSASFSDEYNSHYDNNVGSNFLIKELSKECSTDETVSCEFMGKRGRGNVLKKILLKLDMD